MKYRRVVNGGAVLRYEICQPVSYDHSRGFYYTFVKTKSGEKCVSCLRKNGIYTFTVPFSIHVPDVKGQ